MRLDLRGSALHARNRVHRRVFVAARGRVLGRWGGQPVLLLTTTGRRSGLPRTTMLVALVREPGRVVVAASNGGSPYHPDWFRNLVADDSVEVLAGGRHVPMRARAAAPDERAELWPRVIAGSPAYARYQQHAGREIPLVILTPRHE